jgi:hypothetical protein
MPRCQRGCLKSQGSPDSPDYGLADPRITIVRYHARFRFTEINNYWSNVIHAADVTGLVPHHFHTELVRSHAVPLFERQSFSNNAWK